MYKIYTCHTDYFQTIITRRVTPQSNIVEHFFGTSDSIGFSMIEPEVDIFWLCFVILSLESRPFRVEREVYRLFLNNFRFYRFFADKTGSGHFSGIVPTGEATYKATHFLVCVALKAASPVIFSSESRLLRVK